LSSWSSLKQDELRVLVDELSDQPWTGDAIDLDMFPGNPLHPILLLS
jgi:hypothetical protein